ncbi:MAG: heme exporter protein [Alphaproteobacteria bacterium]|nr:heme exporter protein [Alphaproteobacteria bacterium]
MLRLAVSGLGCVRGQRDVFHDVEFALSAGEALALTGPNGAGKSSLLRLIAGLLRAASGRIELEGGAADLTIPEQAHYQGHLDALKPSLTVAENLAFWIHYLGGATPPGAALATVGIAGLANLPAGYLSAGQRRRLSLARLIAVPRPIWLLDEPTSALDAAAQVRLTELMREHLAGGGMIVAATHGPLGIDAKELRLGRSAPSPLAGEGWGGGAESSSTIATTPTPNPSPQRGGERSGARGKQI